MGECRANSRTFYEKRAVNGKQGEVVLELVAEAILLVSQK